MGIALPDMADTLRQGAGYAPEAVHVHLLLK